MGTDLPRRAPRPSRRDGVMQSSPRSASPRRSRRLGIAVAGLLSGSLLALTGTGSAAQADVVYVPWSSYLPGWTDAYVPTSANDCVAGRPACVKQTLQELNRIQQETGKSCGDHAVFALAYTASPRPTPGRVTSPATTRTCPLPTTRTRSSPSTTPTRGPTGATGTGRTSPSRGSPPSTRRPQGG